MTEEEFAGEVPVNRKPFPEWMRVCIVDMKDEPKKLGIIYYYGVPIFKVRSKSVAYIVRRLNKYIDIITNEEQ